MLNIFCFWGSSLNRQHEVSRWKHGRPPEPTSAYSAAAATTTTTTTTSAATSASVSSPSSGSTWRQQWCSPKCCSKGSWKQVSQCPKVGSVAARLSTRGEFWSKSLRPSGSIERRLEVKLKLVLQRFFKVEQTAPFLTFTFSLKIKGTQQNIYLVEVFFKQV